MDDANLKLEVVRFQMRLAKDLLCLQVKSYGFAAKKIDEIGKLVGGWLKQRQSIRRNRGRTQVMLVWPCHSTNYIPLRGENLDAAT